MNTNKYKTNLEHCKNIIRKTATHRYNQRTIAKKGMVKYYEYINDITHMKNRIQNLIELFIECKGEGVKFPPQEFTDDTEHLFMARPHYQNVGFILNSNTKYDGKKVNIGFYTDPREENAHTFLTNGTDIYTYNVVALLPDTTIKHHASIDDLKKFLNEFDEFESKFYRWIKELEDELSA